MSSLIRDIILLLPLLAALAPIVGLGYFRLFLPVTRGIIVTWDDCIPLISLAIPMAAIAFGIYSREKLFFPDFFVGGFVVIIAIEIAFVALVAQAEPPS